METLVQELYKPLSLYVRKRIKNPEDAEDLTQEVFLKLSKSNNDKINNIKSWVYTIARNTITDYYRKKKIYTEDVEDKAILEEPDTDLVVQELSTWMSSFIEKLPDDYKEVMRLSELEGMSQKEIAAQLDMNYVTVRSKIQRGRKKLKGIFTECCTISQSPSGSILSYQKNNGCGGYCIDENGAERDNNC